MSRREELIRRALMEKIAGGMDIFTADDILAAADITDEEMQEFQEKVQAEVDGLAKKKRRGT